MSDLVIIKAVLLIKKLLSFLSRKKTLLGPIDHRTTVLRERCE